MKNNFIYNSEFSNIYERPNINSNVSTQILFGENFSILKKSRNFYKIKIGTDNYVGFIKKHPHDNQEPFLNFQIHNTFYLEL